MGRLGHRTVKGEIGDDPLLRPLFGTGHPRQSVVDFREIVRCMMNGRQTRRLDLQRNAQLEQGTKTLRRGKLPVLDTDRTCRRLTDEGANALPRFHQTFIAQLRDCLAHDRAADPEGLGKHMLRRQPLAGLQSPLADLLGQLHGDPGRQVFTAPDLSKADLPEVDRHACWSPCHRSGIS